MLASAIAALSLLLAWGSPARAVASMRPLELSVVGDEANWHADRDFTLNWINPTRDGEPPLAAVHYRLLDPSGEQTLLEHRIDWPAISIEHLSVPPQPGAYPIEIWLEDDEGAAGTPITARLRFDDTVPGSVEPPLLDRWLGRTGFPFPLRLGRPAGPAPLSGIRGYAVSIDFSPAASPCAGKRCSEAETDLRGGIAGDLLSVAELPEGVNYLHVVAVSASGVRSATIGTTALRVDKTDPGTRLEGVPTGWSSRPLKLTARATDSASGMTAAGAGGPFTAIRVDGDPPVVATGGAVSTTVIESGVHTVVHYARDAAGNVTDGSGANGLPNREPAAAVVRIDREVPWVAFAGAQDPADPERIEARARDSLSGLDPSRGQIEVRPAGTNERFEPLPTEVAAGALRARWPSEDYRPGEYEFRATAYDLAGNPASTSSRAGGTAMRLRAPLKVATRLLAGFGGRTLRTVPHGRGAQVSGRLIAGRRTPLVGMAVRVIERFEVAGPSGERESTVRTGLGGEFAVRLAPGPSREIVALAPPTATMQGARSQPLRLAVRGGVRLRVSSRHADVGGRPVVFSGRIASAAEIPQDGKAVELQFRLPGLPWSEFRTIRSDRHGHFRLPYRFADDDSRGVSFQFRAFAPAQAGWPFEPAGSRPVTVRGR